MKSRRSKTGRVNHQVATAGNKKRDLNLRTVCIFFTTLPCLARRPPSPPMVSASVPTPGAWGERKSLVILRRVVIPEIEPHRDIYAETPRNMRYGSYFGHRRGARGGLPPGNRCWMAFNSNDPVMFIRRRWRRQTELFCTKLTTMMFCFRRNGMCNFWIPTLAGYTCFEECLFGITCADCY